MNETERKTHDESSGQNISPQEKPTADESCREQLLRLTADFSNYKRRIERERSEWAVSAQASVLDKILPIFDELDRVINLAQEQAADRAWLEGLKLIQKNWQKLFTELGIEEIPTQGSFNPELHEALMHEDGPHEETGNIGKTLSKGYRFKGRVIRHAKVSVIK